MGVMRSLSNRTLDRKSRSHSKIGGRCVVALGRSQKSKTLISRLFGVAPRPLELFCSLAVICVSGCATLGDLSTRLTNVISGTVSGSESTSGLSQDDTQSDVSSQNASSRGETKNNSANNTASHSTRTSLQQEGSQSSDHGVREHQPISHDGTPSKASPENENIGDKDFIFDFQLLNKSKAPPGGVCGLFNVTAHTPGPAVLSVECSGQVVLADIRNNTPYTLLKLTPPFEHIAFNRRTARLAVSSGFALSVFDLSRLDSAPALELKRLKTQISSLEFEPGGEAILIGGVDGKLYRWRFVAEQNAKTTSDRERAFERYVGLASVVAVVRYHPLGRVFFSGDWLGEIGAWQAYDADPFGGKYIENLFGNRYFMQKAVRTAVTLADASAVDQLEVSRDGELLLSGSQKGMIEIWRVRGMMNLGEVQAHDGALAALAFGSDAQSAVSLGRDGKLKMWQIIPHHEYEPNGDAVPYEFIQTREFEVANGRALLALDDGTFLAATAAGQLYQVQ